MKILNKNDYELLGKWVAPTLAWALGSRWAEGKAMKSLGVETQSNLLILDGFGFFTKKVRSDIYQELVKYTDPLNEKYFDQFITVSEDTFNNFLKLAKNPLLGEGEWQESLKLFFQSYEELWCPWFLAFFVGDFVEGEILKLVKKYSINKEALPSFIVSTKKNLSSISRGEMLEIKSFASKNGLSLLLELKDIKIIQKRSKELAKKINDFIIKYEWIGTHHFWGNPLTLERFFTEISEIKPHAKKASSKPEYPQDLRFLVQIAGDLAWMRLQAAECSALVAFAYRPLLQKAAKTLKITYDELIWLTQYEILDGIKQKASISQEIIHERMDGYGGTFTAQKSIVFTGKKLHNLLKIFVPKTNSKITNEIRGIVASKGYAKGKARVVFVPHHINNFNKGDILIAPETTPDYVPLMKMSGAIVTNIGGITSHAAIVSRELKKPCIIGTKIATQVLKDGDLVEVDADKGIVRIIDRIQV